MIQEPLRTSTGRDSARDDALPSSQPKVGATTLPGTSTTDQDAITSGGPTTEVASTLGDPALLAGSDGVQVAGLFEDPRELVQRYVRRGVNALADYLLRRVIEGMTSVVRSALQEAWDNVAGFPEALMGAMERSIGLRRLTGSEISASRAVHGSSLINYSAVRVIPSSYFTHISQMRAFVSFNIIHYPDDSVHLDTACHELTHVAQYQAIGAIYIPQAIHAQHTGGYTYGNLATARREGKTFRSFNREQQAQIAGDFYRVSVVQQAPSSSGSGSLADYTHFIQQMRSGSYW